VIFVLYDIVIQNGSVIDGTGNPWFKADIAIKGEIIAKISDSIDDDAEKIINAKGLIVSPGFIDTHAHDDYLLFVDPFCETKIFQGITTEVAGNCGISAVPHGKRWMGFAWMDDIKYRFDLVESWDKAEEILERHGIRFNWKTTGEYLTLLEKQGVSINYIQLIGVRTLKAATNEDWLSSPTDRELEEEKVLLEQAMEEGAWGISDCGSDHEFDKNELIELCKIVAKKRGVFFDDLTSYGDRLIEAVKEGLEIAEKSNVRMLISHLGVSNKNNWGKIETALKLMDEARARGMEIYCDQIPYTIGGPNYYSPSVDFVLPDWVFEGGTDQTISRLRDKETREKIKQEIKEGVQNKWQKKIVHPGAHRAGVTPMWEDMYTILSHRNKALEGKTIYEIARSRKANPYDILLDIASEDPSVKAVFITECEEDIIKVMKHPTTMFGTDGGTIPAIKRPGIPHPRIYGAFPRVLGRYVREKGVLTLEEAVRKMTSLPAQALRLNDRGLIREGMYADITIFNPQTVLDNPSYTEFPKDFDQGIEYVLVNGKVVLEKGKHTKTLAGKVLRHK